MKEKKIDFLPINKEAELFVDPPLPAQKHMPEWFKRIPAFSNNKPEINEVGNVNKTVKICSPFSDALKFGYIQKTWQEIKIEKTDDGSFMYAFPNKPYIIGVREKTHFDKEFFGRHYNDELFWQMQWSPKLPKGYSVLIVHPLNRQDLPFTTLSGVIDADDYFQSKEGKIPFLLDKDFEGIIPMGTPMYQIIPFKRENWKMWLQKFDIAKTKNGEKIASMFWGGYQKLFWKKKYYR